MKTEVPPIQELIKFEMKNLFNVILYIFILIND